MKCKICGGEIMEGADVCPICGVSVAASESAADAASKIISGQGSDRSDAASEQSPKPQKSKYSMVGGNVTQSNPFGMDPNNTAAREAQMEAKRALEREAGMEARILDEPEGTGSYGSGAYGQGAYGQAPYVPPVNGQPPYGQERPPFDPSAFDSGPNPFRPAAPAVPQKVNKNTVTIIVVCSLCVIALLVVVWKMNLFGGEADGTYKFVNAEGYGQTISPEQFKSLGMDVDDFYLKISGKTATVSLMGRVGRCKVEFSGNDVSFIEDNQTIKGTYNKEKGTISIEQDGIKLNFKK